MASIGDISDHPKYTIKLVCEQTGIRPVTLRAWERRYQILSPHRTDNKYRQYSARDMEILRWVKDQVDRGVQISQAASEMRTMIRNGIWPNALPAAPEQVTDQQPTTPPGMYAKQLYEALIHHDEEKAGDLLRQAHSIFDLTTICMEVITPCLVEIGEAWFYGKIRVTTEHFASAFLRGKLLSLLQSLPYRRSAPYILVGCAPDEAHEIGSLMVAVLLRSAGFHIEYLGPDILVEDLVDYATYEKPAMIILSATSSETALQLKNVDDLLQGIRPRPIFGYGGRIFWMEPETQKKVKGIYLGNTLEEAVISIQNLLKKKP